MSRHQMRPRDKRSGITREDLTDLEREFGIRAPEWIIDAVADVLADWPTYARDTAVPSQDVRRIRDALATRRKEVG